MYYENFEKLCKERGIRPADVSRGTGISTATLTSWKKGAYTPKSDKLALIASFFGVSLDYLMGVSASPLPKSPEWQDADEFEAELNERPESVWVPVIGRVAAGFRKIMNEEILGFEPVDYDLAESGRFFALRIAGDSMEPEIKKGSTAIVRCQQDADSGDVCVVTINGDEATCKRIQKTDNGIMLVSTNPAYPPRYFSAKDIKDEPVTILGRVMEVRTKF